MATATIGEKKTKDTSSASNAYPLRRNDGYRVAERFI